MPLACTAACGRLPPVCASLSQRLTWSESALGALLPASAAQACPRGTTGWRCARCQRMTSGAWTATTPEGQPKVHMCGVHRCSAAQGCARGFTEARRVPSKRKGRRCVGLFAAALAPTRAPGPVSLPQHDGHMHRRAPPLSCVLFHLPRPCHSWIITCHRRPRAASSTCFG